VCLREPAFRLPIGGHTWGSARGSTSRQGVERCDPKNCVLLLMKNMDLFAWPTLGVQRFEGLGHDRCINERIGDLALRDSG
jgi:hypothetical protein